MLWHAKQEKKTNTSTHLIDFPKTQHVNKVCTWMEYEYWRGEIPKTYPRQDVVYEFNSHGYRCRQLEKDIQGFNVITLGCSEAFGYCLKVEETFAQIVCNHIPDAVNYNLSIPGKSNDYISRCLLDSLVLKPDLVLICFTTADRREYFDGLGKVYDFLPRIPMEKIPRGPLKDVWARLLWLSNLNEDNLNFFKNFKIIEQALELNNIKWYYSSLEEIPNENIRKDNYLGVFERIDVAVDDFHRGIRSHQKLASKFIDKVKIDFPYKF